MNWCVDFILALMFSFSIMINLCIAAAITTSSIGEMTRLLEAPKMFVYEIYQGRNWFGCIISTVITLFVLPGLIISIIIHVVYLTSRFVWRLGNKKANR